MNVVKPWLGQVTCKSATHNTFIPLLFNRPELREYLNGPADSDKIIEKSSSFHEQLPPFLLCLLSIFPRSSQETWIKIKNSLYVCECRSALSARLCVVFFSFSFYIQELQIK